MVITDLTPKIYQLPIEVIRIKSLPNLAIKFNWETAETISTLWPDVKIELAGKEIIFTFICGIEQESLRRKVTE